MGIFSNKRKLLILGISIALGVLAGFAYWKFIGCQSGSCGITAKWHTSALFGGILGYLIGDTISGKKRAKDKNNLTNTDSETVR